MKAKKRVGIAIIILVVFLLLAGAFAYYWSWRQNYQNRIYPNIKLGDLNLGGKTLEEAEAAITAKKEKIETAGLKLQYGNKQTAITAIVASFDSDLSYPAFSYNVEETASRALGNRLERTFLNYLWRSLRPKSPLEITAVYDLNEEKIKSLVADSFKELEIPSANAFFSLAKDGQLKTNSEKLGKEINYEELLKDIRNNLNNLKTDTIAIKTQTKYPTVKQGDLKNLGQEAQTMIGNGDLILTFQEQAESTSTENLWRIKPERLITWVSVLEEDNKLKLSLDSEKIKQYLVLNVSPQIDKEAVRPRFEISTGKVVNWQSGLNGRQVDIEATASRINQDFLAGKKEVALITKEISADNISGEENFYIKEIVGTGYSNFAGSPENRRKNIAVGARAVHGILIKPGEEFSLVKTLGDISEKTGYFPELVIKGNKTLPEYGGGLCQIGTTIFRTALATGLPITARQNHSYRVAYYEPAGTDAAVYMPWPDVRFVNDTGNYILIQSRLNKNDLYFDFWGVKDGRIATTTKLVVYNIVKPAPTKLIETDSLPAGQKKCTEKAHNGADAYFDYKVIYPAGATTTPIQERRFKSHYVPWQEVCLVGIGTASSTTATGTSINLNASSTSATSTNKKAAGNPAATSSILTR